MRYYEEGMSQHEQRWMSTKDKRIEAMRRNPKNVRPAELDAVLRGAGFVVRQHGTSHRVYKRGGAKISVPQRHPYLLRRYVEEALALLDLLDSEPDGED
jgi:hypothetical protein